MSATAAATVPEVASLPPLDLAYPRTVTEMRHVIGSTLILGTIDGQRWATNSYYITPAERFKAFDELADGRYLAEGKGWRVVSDDADDAAGLLRRFLDPDLYVEPVDPRLFGGRPVLVPVHRAPEKMSDETLAVVIAESAGLNARYLRLVADVEALSKPYGDVYGAVRLRQMEGAMKPVGVFTEVSQRRGGHRDPHAEGYVWIPETVEPAGERLIGVIMPVQLGGAA